MLADSESQSQIQVTPMKEEPKPPRQPGDLILDKYMPNATPLEREEARFNLLQYAKVIIAINKRIEADENRKKQADAADRAG